MEAKSEIVNGSRLCVKRGFFEQEFGVSEEGWLLGEGWLAFIQKSIGDSLI